MCAYHTSDIKLPTNSSTVLNRRTCLIFRIINGTVLISATSCLVYTRLCEFSTTFHSSDINPQNRQALPLISTLISFRRPPSYHQCHAHITDASVHSLRPSYPLVDDQSAISTWRRQLSGTGMGTRYIGIVNEVTYSFRSTIRRRHVKSFHATIASGRHH